MPHAASLITEFSDMGEMTASHPILKQQYVQLERGSFKGDVVGILLGGGLLWRSRANLSGYGSAEIPEGHLLVAFVGPHCRKELWHGVSVTADSLAVGDPRTGHEHSVGSNHESCAWLLPVDRYRCDAAALGLDVPSLEVVKSPVIAARQGETGRLREIVNAALQYAALDPQALHVGMPWLENALVSSTLHCLARPVPPLASSRALPSLARAARDLIHDHAANPLSIVELCRRLGASERTLRYQFSLAYQCSPLEYQLALRLKLVQQRLREARPEKGAVGHAAAALGFWHMGRFTAQYRRLLGESPSQTLLGTPGREGSWPPRQARPTDEQLDGTSATGGLAFKS